MLPHQAIGMAQHVYVSSETCVHDNLRSILIGPMEKEKSISMRSRAYTGYGRRGIWRLQLLNDPGRPDP